MNANEIYKKITKEVTTGLDFDYNEQMVSISKWIESEFIPKPNVKMKLDGDKTKNYKSLFITYFDGCYDVDAEPNTPSTYQMGICKIEYIEKTNRLMIHLRRPGLLIGKGGSLINKLEKDLGCEIDITEVIL